MQYDKQRDKILGAVFGCALGDALGLPAEGGNRAILAERYPDGLSLPHKNACRGFPLNDWTDDTDQTILIMRSSIGSHEDRACDFAKRLVCWFNKGFPELGDESGMGCGNMTWRVLRRDDFTTDPFKAAEAIIGPKAGNGALMRTAPLAFTKDPEYWAEYFAKTTHADKRCVASCVAQCVLIRAVAEADPTPEMLRTALNAAYKHLDTTQRSELLSWMKRSESLDAIEVDARDAQGYTFKAFACSIWGFRQLLKSKERDAAFFKKTLTELVMRAGDADTNAAIAGALLGASLGYNALPRDWIEAMPHWEWLLDETLGFIEGISI